MKIVNQKIIDAVIEKAEKLCPDSLDLIGIYGSAATGDEHEKSDLDLLILIQNNEGWQLGTGFILDDLKIGYDIYCTNWDGLKYDAVCHHAQISKLMDSKIVYIKNQEAYHELGKLREQAKLFLESEERFQRVKELVEKAKISYADSHLHEDLGEVRMDAYEMMHYLSDAMMLFHGCYFKRGVKRTFIELEKLPISDEFSSILKKVVAGKEISELRELLKSLLRCTESYISQEKQKKEPDQGLTGTYEEMYSNWRNKVAEAADNQDVFSSFVNMCGLQSMLSDISEDNEIGTYNIMEEYNPDCLKNNLKLFDATLQKYEEIYNKAGIKIKHFSDVDEFVKTYLEK